MSGTGSSNRVRGERKLSGREPRPSPPPLRSCSHVLVNNPSHLCLLSIALHQNPSRRVPGSYRSIHTHLRSLSEEHFPLAHPSSSPHPPQERLDLRCFSVGGYKNGASVGEVISGGGARRVGGDDGDCQREDEDGDEGEDGLRVGGLRWVSSYSFDEVSLIMSSTFDGRRGV